MRTKLMLEALAAWLALAAASGQACASIQTGAQSASGATSVLTVVANPIVIDPESSLGEITTPYSHGNVPARDSNRAKLDVALLTPAAAARKETPNRATNAVRAPAQLKRWVAFSRHEVVGAPGPRAVLVAANGRSDMDAEKFYLIANPKPAAGTTVPEPGNWAKVLAGLLGVIAIARRRMSL